jgi:hypothetical protein
MEIVVFIAYLTTCEIERDTRQRLNVFKSLNNCLYLFMENF